MTRTETRTGTCTAGDLAKYLGAELRGDASALVSGVASPERARTADLIYVDSARHAERAAKSAAVCVIAGKGVRIEGKTLLEVSVPKLAFAKAATAAGERSDAPSERASDGDCRADRQGCGERVHRSLCGD